MVMKSLRRLLEFHSCTVVCSLSQPSSDLMEYIDNYVFLLNGIVVFNGGLHQLADMVGVIQEAPVEVAFEVVLAFMDILSGDNEEQIAVVKEWRERKNISMLLLKQNACVTSSVNKSLPSVDSAAVGDVSNPSRRREMRLSFAHQVLVLARRHFLHQYRAANGIRTTFALHIITGVIVGVLYYRNIAHLEDLPYLGNPFTHVFESYTLNVIGWHMACPLMIVLARAIPIPVMVYTRAIYDREQVSNTPMNTTHCLI